MFSLRHAKAYWQLGKPGISAAVSLSSLTAFLLHSKELSAEWFPLMTGIFLLSFASSGINQIQEKDIDSRMQRTKGRPLPGGHIGSKEAFSLVVITLITGSFLLWLAGGPMALFLGWTTITLYNAIYTPLKTKTLFAIIPGSLVGALPPLIGWISAGGDPFHLHIMLVGMFFFTGQVPHTWLILIRYEKEYVQAGLPSLNQYFNRKQAAILNFIWITATAMCLIMFGIFGIFGHNAFAAATIALAFMMVFWFAARIFDRHSTTHVRNSFILLNIVYLSSMLLIIADSLMIN